MLDLDPSRRAVPPKDAATLVVVRGASREIEVFCVERQRAGFLGGAIVFPGGKLDALDLDPGWADVTTAPRRAEPAWAADDVTLRALAVAACRESLEEAAILPLEGGALGSAELLALRRSLLTPGRTLLDHVRERGARLDLQALVPLARWVTPEAESRRYDTRFYLYVAPPGTEGAHDDHETTASFWASPRDVLRRFDAGELQLAPPTHRTLEIFSACQSSEDAVRVAEAACLDVICPQLVPQGEGGDATVALVIPGDPQHAVSAPRCPGRSRFVLRGERFLPEDPPMALSGPRGTP